MEEVRPEIISESNVTTLKKSLREVVGEISYKYLVNKLLNSRKVGEDGIAGFGEITHETDTEKLTIKAIPVDLEDITKNAKGSCKQCGYGRGYFVIHIAKKKLQDPRGFMVLDTDPPEGCTEEQKREWKKIKDKETTWKIVKVCDCAVKESVKKDPNLVVDSNNVIFIKTDYTSEAK